MNVNLPKKEKLSTKTVIIYTISIIACIIALIITGLVIYFGSDELDRLIVTGGSTISEDEEEYQALVSGFETIFQNQLEEYTIDIDVQKIDEEQDLVYTYYTLEEDEKNSYEIDLNIPYINIDSDIIEKYNEEIRETYEEKAESILQTTNGNVIYSLEYEATIENDILSLIIRTNLKEGTNAQRLIIQTFNYDLKNDKEVTLEEMINIKGLNSDDVQNKINEEITSEQERVENLKSLGYSIFERDAEDDMYLIENSQDFFVKDGNIYIIYAYGNENITSEMDLVIV